jgi:hypothetical protein
LRLLLARIGPLHGWLPSQGEWQPAIDTLNAVRQSLDQVRGFFYYDRTEFVTKLSATTDLRTAFLSFPKSLAPNEKAIFLYFLCILWHTARFYDKNDGFLEEIIDDDWLKRPEDPQHWLEGKIPQYAANNNLSHLFQPIRRGLKRGRRFYYLSEHLSPGLSLVFLHNHAVLDHLPFSELPKMLHLLNQKAYPDITDLGYFLSPDIVTCQDRYNFQIQMTGDG